MLIAWSTTKPTWTFIEQHWLRCTNQGTKNSTLKSPARVLSRKGSPSFLNCVVIIQISCLSCPHFVLAMKRYLDTNVPTSVSRPPLLTFFLSCVLTYRAMVFHAKLKGVKYTLLDWSSCIKDVQYWNLICSCVWQPLCRNYIKCYKNTQLFGHKYFSNLR